MISIQRGDFGYLLVLRFGSGERGSHWVCRIGLKGGFSYGHVQATAIQPAGIPSGSICAIDVIQANRRQAMRKMS